MSGHSKWSTIKHKKAKTDAARGKLFGRLIREITVAARQGGADPESNARLRAAIQAARAANMPMANIERAIGKATGADGASVLEEISYEGYGPGGVAILVEVVTDNRNRTASEIRHIFSKGGGRLGESGCVAWMFDARGSIQVDCSVCDEDTVLTVALEAGAADVKTDLDEVFELLTEASELHQVAQVLEQRSIPFHDVEQIKVPTNTIDVSDQGTAAKLLRLLDALEDHDDVQNVWSNFDIPDAMMAKIT